MAVLGLRFCARAFSSCGKRGPLLIAVRGPLTIAASLVAEHRLQTRRLSNCGSRAQLLHGTWDPPRPGLEPVSPALADRLSTTAPPGKPNNTIFNIVLMFRRPRVNLKVMVLKQQEVRVFWGTGLWQNISFHTVSELTMTLQWQIVVGSVCQSLQTPCLSTFVYRLISSFLQPSGGTINIPSFHC